MQKPIPKHNNLQMIATCNSPLQVPPDRPPADNRIAVDVYADFLKAIGHAVIQTTSAYWFDVHSHCFLAFPYHHSIDPAKDELKELFRSAMMLRYVSKSSGVKSYCIACDQKPYTLESLTSKARNQTRRGLENWKVEQVGCDWLAANGERLNADTLSRQGRRQSEFDQSRWKRFCNAAATRSGFEGWAAVANGKVGAVALSFIMGEVAYIFLQRSLGSELGTYPNNALSFGVTERMLSRPSIRMVFYGLRPLAASSTLDHFKLGMGYREVPIRECFSIAPHFKPFVPFARFAASRLGGALNNEAAKKFAVALGNV